MNQLYIKSLLLGLCFLIGSYSYAGEVVFSQDFKTRIQGISITTNRSLEITDEGTYVFLIKTSNFFVKLQEESVFERLEDGSFRPLSNKSERKILGVSRKFSTTFDWNSMVATYERGDEIKETVLEPGMVDRTMYQYLIELELRSGNPVLNYQVVDRGRIRNYIFENLGVEDIEIEGQPMSASKLRRVSDDGDRETLVWMSVELDYEMVKIFHSDDGDEYTMTRKI